MTSKMGSAGKAGLNRLNPKFFFSAGLCQRLEAAKVQEELGWVAGEIDTRGGDGHTWSVFTQQNIHLFLDGETETPGRKKDLSHRM